MILSWALYRRNTERWFVGRKVRCVVPIKSKIQSVDVGTEFIIKGKLKGFILEGPKCAHCGVKILFRKVDPGHLELVE